MHASSLLALTEEVQGRGWVLWLVAVMAHAGVAQTAEPASDSASSATVQLLGTWQVCGSARIDARDTNPRGIESNKRVF